MHKIQQYSRSFFVFFLPGGFIVLAAFLLIHFNLINPWINKIERIAPYVILSIGVILGWRFHRSRLALVICILFLSERSLFYFGSGGTYDSGHGNIVLLTNGILLPLNLALFYLVKERALLSLSSLLRIFIILLQPLAVFLLIHIQPDIFQFLSYQLIKDPSLINLPLSQPVLLVYGFFLLAFFTGSLFGGDGPTGRGFFWALVASLLALAAKNNGQSATLYYCTAGFVIIISVIESAYAMAFHDDLTGLPARRAMTTALQGLSRQYAIAMIDIDYFKKFNDRFGHDVGDQVLCMVASRLRIVSGGGKPYRYGGEEFTILFPGKTKEEVIPHLEQLRQVVETSQFILRDKNRPRKPPKKIQRSKKQTNSVSVTISIGVAESDRRHPRPSSVLKAADQALYRAKKRGRNCIST